MVYIFDYSLSNSEIIQFKWPPGVKDAYSIQQNIDASKILVSLVGVSY